MLRLRDIMTTEVLTVTPETSLRAAMELFATRHISGAPVVSGERVVGVISAADVVSFTSAPVEPPDARAAMDETEESLDVPAWDEGDEPSSRWFTELWAGEQGDVADRIDEPVAAPWDPLAERTVADAMTWGVYALPPGAEVAAAAECMRSAGVHRMLVMEGGRLLGIVTTMDLVRAVAEHRIVRRTFVFDRRPAS
jgi:CBS domain-containing protein